MATQRPKAPRTRAALVPVQVGDAATSRALDSVAESVRRLERSMDRVNVEVDLVVGDNRIVHGLGRPPRGASVTPSVADATFAWALTASDERMATITVVGIDQPGALIEVW